jgi:hypothetical protein
MECYKRTREITTRIASRVRQFPTYREYHSIVYIVFRSNHRAMQHRIHRYKRTCNQSTQQFIKFQRLTSEGENQSLGNINP